jgi:hypothetical protein
VSGPEFDLLTRAEIGGETEVAGCGWRGGERRSGLGMGRDGQSWERVVAAATEGEVLWGRRVRGRRTESSGRERYRSAPMGFNSFCFLHFAFLFLFFFF